MSRSIITIEDLTNHEIEAVFRLADEYLSEMHDRKAGWRVRGRLKEANEVIASTLFYEPSTRTKFSFETAVLRLGGHVISSADPTTTSAAKGETLADTVRVIQNYADLIILRHPCEGAARLASEYSDVPVINAGDGGHEHPTQTLCDLYTLRRERNESIEDGYALASGGEFLFGLNVLLCGDLKNGRTVHSLVYALARFGANILPSPAPGLELPEHVARRLEWEYGSIPKRVVGKKDINDLPVDVVYVTPHEPHQQALFPDVRVDVKLALDRKDLSARSIDVCYVTRLQKERISSQGKKAKQYPVVDREFLREARFANTRVLHPLPRVDELSYDLDGDPRGAYFKQAAYGVPVRMALIASLLELRPDILGTERSNLRYDRTYSKTIGIECTNPKCITNAKSESRYVEKKLWIVNRDQMHLMQSDRPLTLRCCYCEFDMVAQNVGNQRSGEYYADTSHWDQIKPEDLVAFASATDAERHGFKPASAPAGDPVMA